MVLRYHAPAHSFNYVVEKMYEKEEGFTDIGKSFIDHAVSYIENEINILDNIEEGSFGFQNRLDRDLAEVIRNREGDTLHKSEIGFIKKAYLNVVENLEVLKDTPNDIYSSRETYENLYNFVRSARDIVNTKFLDESK